MPRPVERVHDPPEQGPLNIPEKKVLPEILEDVLPVEAVIGRRETAAGNGHDHIDFVEEGLLRGTSSLCLHGCPGRQIDCLKRFEDPVGHGCGPRPSPREAQHHEDCVGPGLLHFLDLILTLPLDRILTGVDGVVGRAACKRNPQSCNAWQEVCNRVFPPVLKPHSLHRFDSPSRGMSAAFARPYGFSVFSSSFPEAAAGTVSLSASSTHPPPMAW